VVTSWLVVASADHVRRGREGGFVQAGHGKAAPLRRMAPGDGVVCYSPSRIMGEKDGFQSFTAIGRVREGRPYQAEMAPDFKPWRRDVAWMEAVEHGIAPLKEWLEFTTDKSWGYKLRLGLIEIPKVDFDFLVHVMTQADMADT
jgi:hypothetical protein